MIVKRTLVAGVTIVACGLLAGVPIASLRSAICAFPLLGRSVKDGDPRSVAADVADALMLAEVPRPNDCYCLFIATLSGVVSFGRIVTSVM